MATKIESLEQLRVKTAKVRGVKLKKIIVRILALFIITSLFVTVKLVAAENPKMGGTLNVGLHIPFATLDWQSTVGHPAPQVQSNVWEGLYAYGSDFTAAPELAESYQASSDGKTWTFKLRKGVLFHNLKEMTAEDVIASIKRWQKVGPKGASLETNKIEALDKYTVRLNFKDPIGQTLLLLLGSDENKCVIMPKEVAEASPTSGNLTEIIGTGPYKWDEYKEDQYIRLTKFEEYVSRDDKPNYQTGKKVAYLDEIIFWIVPEYTTRLAGLESGDYDIITKIGTADYERLLSAKDIDPIKKGPAFNFYLMFNQQKGLTSKLNIRRAIQAAINAEEIMGAAIPNPDFRVLDPSFYPPESAYYNFAGGGLYNQNDVEKAKEYLKKAGYNGERITFQSIATNPVQVRIGVAIVSQLKKAGMNAELLSIDLQTWVSNRRNGNVLMMYHSGGNWIDPSLYQPEFNGTFPSVETAFSDPEVDAVFKRLNQETNFLKRKKHAKELQRLFYEKVATYSFGHHYRLTAKRSNVIDPEGNLARGNLTLNNIGLK